MIVQIPIAVNDLGNGEFSWIEDQENERRLKKLISLYKATKDDKGWKNFDGFMAQVLIRAVKVMKTAEVKWLDDRADKNSTVIIKPVENVILRQDMNEMFSEGNYVDRMQDLKWFGLTSQRPEWWHQGIYQATPLTFDFLRGTASVPRSVRIIGKTVVDKTADQISFQEAVGAEWNTLSEWIAQWRGVGVPGR